MRRIRTAATRKPQGPLQDCLMRFTGRAAGGQIKKAALLLGLSNSSLHEYLDGTKTPTVETLRDMADRMIALDYFRGRALDSLTKAERVDYDDRVWRLYVQMLDWTGRLPRRLSSGSGPLDRPACKAPAVCDLVGGVWDDLDPAAQGALVEMLEPLGQVLRARRGQAHEHTWHAVCRVNQSGSSRPGSAPPVRRGASAPQFS